MGQVTGAIVFTDLVGFTEFTALSGDAEALRLLTVQESIVRALLPDGARIVKELGDGLMIYFPDVCSAITTMLLVLEKFEAATDEEMLPLLVRVGGHWGSPSVRGDDLVGHDANVAARIVDVASPGELLVSDALLDAADPITADFSELGPVVMKGLVEPVPLFRVDAPLDAHSRGLTSA